MKKKHHALLSEKIRSLLQDDSSKPHPVAKATYMWSILSEQLETLLGQEVYNQWFKKITPLVVSETALLLKTDNDFSSYWIDLHYKDLVNTLLQCQDKDVFSFFLSPSLVKEKDSAQIF